MRVRICGATFVALVAALIGIVGCGVLRFDGATGGPGDLMTGSFQGQTPPSIASGATWLNVEAPLDLKSLHGKVVWLEFSFLS